MTPEQITAIGTLLGAVLFTIWKASQADRKAADRSVHYESKFRQQQDEIRDLRDHNKLLEGRLHEQRETYTRQIEILMGRVLELERALAQTQEHEKILASQLAAEQGKSEYFRKKLEELEDKAA